MGPLFYNTFNKGNINPVLATAVVIMNDAVVKWGGGGIVFGHIINLIF
jgi:hypothetical protein